MRTMTEPLEHYRLSPMQRLYRAMKAALDFFIAFFALVFLIPAFIVIAILIKLDSPGPVFFVHDRIGKGGRPFRCIKFRSMAVDARPDLAGYQYAEVNSYITKVGAFLRKTSLDELPQLYCVLAFRMSLIGYRPSQSSELELNSARESCDMYQLRPGISGWAQINGRDMLASHPTQKACYDAYYLHHFSLWLDIKIFFLTIVRVFKGADIEEGVLDAETTPAAAEAETIVEAETAKAEEKEPVYR